MEPDDPGLQLARHYASEAEAYRKHWAPVLEPLGRMLVRSMAIGRAQPVLDLGCGVGALLPHLREAATDALVVGLDRTEAMVALAPADFARVVGEAARLPFRDACLEAVAMAFMLFHLPEPSAGLDEVGRVLRPGGTLGVLTWGGENTSRAFLEWDAELEAYGAPSTGPKLAWHERVDTPAKVSRLLKRAGFTEVTSRIEMLVERPSRDEFVARRLKLGCCRHRLEALDEVVRTRFTETATRRIGALAPEDFEEESEVIVTLARRPG
jgi:ubiquinone/menaquinone biosynthesis C-methylase UbiE